jgi:hypothetical protein
MIWLQTPPWGRWILAALVAVIAVWLELRPQTMVDHPFAAAPIPSGESIGDANTEMRKVPAGLFEPVEMGETVARDVPEGAPVLAIDLVGIAAHATPKGWWVVAIPVPTGARPGDEVKVVVVDTGREVDGVVTAGAPSDPLGSGQGAVALPPEGAAEVATAAFDGRVAVLVATP